MNTQSTDQLTGVNWDTVTRFNFTYAIPGGAWIETADGYRNWFSFDYIAKHKGQAWIDRQLRKQGWMTGCWVDVS